MALLHLVANTTDGAEEGLNPFDDSLFERSRLM